MARRNNLEVLEPKRFLTHAMAKLDEATVYNLIRQGLAQGLDPFELVEEVRGGMEKVGELYELGLYFLGDLMVAADIFLEALSLVYKSKGIEPVSNLPSIVFGTVQGDIHDIGKNLTIGVLKGKGYRICDLGVDVAEQTFLEAIKQTGSPILCLSGLITTAYDSMKRTIDLLVKQGLRSQVTVVIGGLVNEAIREYTGADYWIKDCFEVSKLFNRLTFNYRQPGVASF